MSDLIEMRQQLADVTNERDELRESLSTMTASAQSIRDEWRVDQGKVEALYLQLKASEARNVAVVGACDLAASAIDLDLYGRGANFVRVLREIQRKAQSAPATNSSATNDLPDGHLTDEGTKAPAIDEQGAGQRDAKTQKLIDGCKAAGFLGSKL